MVFLGMFLISAICGAFVGLLAWADQRRQEHTLPEMAFGGVLIIGIPLFLLLCGLYMVCKYW